MDNEQMGFLNTSSGVGGYPNFHIRLMIQYFIALVNCLRNQSNLIVMNGALDRDEKRRLREFHRGICQSASGADLYAVLHRYRDWLATIPDAQRADLLELSPTERIAQIRKIRQSQQASSFRLHAGDIKTVDAMAIAKWLHDYVQDNSDQLLAQLPETAKTPSNHIIPAQMPAG